jgi:hypothetical protein
MFNASYSLRVKRRRLRGRYYTDRGNLSPDAFSRWTSISTVALSVNRLGQLGEDVSGENVSVSGGVITLPAGVLPSAASLPVAIVYDSDGAVTDALLGQGAGDANSCCTNAAYGGVDSFGADAHFLHALVVLNGVCAQTPAQLPDMEYHLVRVLGRVLGLDWSQMNVNVFTRSPLPTPADYTGLTIMQLLTRLVVCQSLPAIPMQISRGWMTAQRYRACTL